MTQRGASPESAKRSLTELFLRHGIIPEPAVASKLRVRAIREIGAFDTLGRPSDKRIEEWGSHRSKKVDWYDRALRRLRARTSCYLDWRPTEDDWVRLAIALAVHHNEPGFEFVPPSADRTAESRWIRDLYMDAARLNPATGMLSVDQATGSPSVSARAASHIAAKAIDAANKDGYFTPPEGDPSLKVASAAYLETDYSKRQAARARREMATGKIEPAEFPPSLRTHQLARSHIEMLFEAGVRMTDWVEPAYCSDAHAATRQTLGPQVEPPV